MSTLQDDRKNHETSPTSAASPGSSPPSSGAAADEPYKANGLEHETTDEEADAIGAAIIAAIKTCYDPEIPVDIYELGLIYAVELEGRHAIIRMTLTSPMCPVAESLPLEVEQRVREVEGVGSAEIDLVWEPPWNPDMMSEAARLELGF